MARKSKPASAPADPAAPGPHGTNGTDGTANGALPSRKKRKHAEIDWSTYGHFEGFAIKRRVTTKKRKTAAGEGGAPAEATSSANIVQPNPVEGSGLGETYHQVQPKREWESMQTYKNFTLRGETFKVGDFVYIRPSKIQDYPNAVVKGWVARVLEVRAGNSEHVYLLVCWLYRPEDLPGGRQPYHGETEVIASNFMDIIDAKTVDSKAEVEQWEEHKEIKYLDSDVLIWRQWYDFSGKTPKLSELNKHCTDSLPCNPDELLVQCSSCEKWLHGHCLEEAAVREQYESHDLQLPKKKPGRKRKQEGPAFTAAIYTTEKGETRLTITDEREGEVGKSWNVPVKCLLCDTVIEATDNDQGPPISSVSDKGITVTDDRVQASPSDPTGETDSVTEDVITDEATSASADTNGEPTPES